MASALSSLGPLLRRLPGSRRPVLSAAILIFALGLGLRLYHLGSYPEHDATADEYAWTWSGMTLLQEGQPRAWSLLRAYGPWEGDLIQWRGIDLHMVEPYLDHPPLYSLVMGLWMTALGCRDIFAVDLAVMRLLSVILFGAGFVLAGLLLRRSVDSPTLLLGLLFYATSFPVVLNTKLVVSENLLAPVFLAAILCLLEHVDTGRRRYLVALGICALALPLIKVAALSLSLALLALAVQRRHLRAGAVVCGATALGVAGVLGYGWAVGGSFFLEVLANQSQRFTGFSGAYNIFLVPTVVNQAVGYGLLMLGFFALVAELLRGRAITLALPAVIYGCAMALFVNAKGMFGWYVIPMYPFICAGAAMVVRRLWDDERGWGLWLWLLLVLPLSFDLLRGAVGAGGDVPLRVLYLTLLLAAPFLLLRPAPLGPRPRHGLVAALVGAQLIADLYFGTLL